MKNPLSLRTYIVACWLMAGCGGGGSTPAPESISVTISPTSAVALDANQSNSFTANVSNDGSNRGVSWMLSCPVGESACGSLAVTKTMSGGMNNYSAPASLSAAETVTITATSVSDSTKTKSVSVIVNPALVPVSPAPPQPQPGVAGQPFSVDLMAYIRGGTLPCNWVVKSGTMPMGLTLDGSTGMIGGTPTASGTTKMAFNCTDSGNPPVALSSNLQISLTINLPDGLAITSGPPPNGAVASRYNPGNGVSCFPSPSGVGCEACFVAAQLRICPPGWRYEQSFFFRAAKGVPPYNWSWSPAPNSSLPPGLTLFSNGSFRGTPTATGTYNIVVTVTDSGSPAVLASANYAIVIGPPPAPIISTTPAPSAGAVSLAYSFTFTVASGGQPPFNWSEAGALPPGLSLSNDGALSGTPTSLGSFPIMVMVQDAVGQNAAPQDFTIYTLLHGFKATGSMATGRSGHTATLLADGKVLLTGGSDASGESVATCDLFDPVSGTFASISSMGTARGAHSATLLSGGKVLVAGGNTETAELFDPVSKSFALTGSMETARSSQTATKLNSGKVLVTGGSDAGGHALANAELFDPSTESFTSTGSMAMARFGHTATLLNNGKVLVTGGTGANGESIATAEVFDPTTSAFASTANMGTARYAHTATVLANGKVLTVGGFDSNFIPLATAELFDPATGVFNTTGSMEMAHAFHTATLLDDGTVLISGGEDASRNTLSSAQVYDYVTGTFALTGSMGSARSSHTATLLNDGMVLVTGGDSGGPLSTAELYQ